MIRRVASTRSARPAPWRRGTEQGEGGAEPDAERVAAGQIEAPAPQRLEGADHGGGHHGHAGAKGQRGGAGLAGHEPPFAAERTLRENPTMWPSSSARSARLIAPGSGRDRLTGMDPMWR
jgi:hypothetical protein